MLNFIHSLFALQGGKIYVIKKIESDINENLTKIYAYGNLRVGYWYQN